MWRLAAVVVLTGLIAPELWASPNRGYRARACGFDMDDDGIVGEPDDDCYVGDGSTTDPDGDGIEEDIFYIDCDGGTNNRSCGTAGSPCLTITYAMNNRADGPKDGAEDIFAFKGICSPDSLAPRRSGVSGTKTRLASGSESRDFELPDNPMMLLGWDADNDGVYPPLDPDDTAILDGTGLDYAFNMDVSNGGGDYLELAHFTIRNYGRNPEPVQTGGVMQVGKAYNYLHDLSLVDIAREMKAHSSRIVFNMFSSTGAEYFYVENIECLDCGAWFARGSGPNSLPSTGPWRFQNIHWTAHACSFGSPGCDSGSFSVVGKLWGYVTGIEWLDSVFDGAPENREIGPHPSAWPSGILASQCTQDVLVRNNEFINISSAAGAQGYARGFCDNDSARVVDDVVIDRNLMRLTTGKYTPIGFVNITTGGDSAGEHAEDVTITNNAFVVSGAGSVDSCVRVAMANTGAPLTGAITITNNTCNGDQSSDARGGILIERRSGSVHQDFLVKNNIFTNLGPRSVNISVGYAPTGWVADSNTFDSRGEYSWDGTPRRSLGSWRDASGGDRGSARCKPALEDDGYHLDPADLCAVDAGEDLSHVSDRDIDGESRALGSAWDVGADAVHSGGLGIHIFPDPHGTNHDPPVGVGPEVREPDAAQN